MMIVLEEKQRMAATFPIIRSRVGEGGQKSGVEVKRIQQLLLMAGYTTVGTPDGGWGKNTKDALMKFHTDLGRGPVTPYIDPMDACDSLCELAGKAKVVFYVPAHLRSNSAAQVVFDICSNMRITYGWQHGDKTYGGGTRMIWGFEQRPNLAIATKPGGKNTALFDTTKPITLNCTGFANVMISCWYQGNIHAAPYDSSQAVGGFEPLAHRYALPKPSNANDQKPVNVYKDVQAIKDVLQSDRIYHFAACNSEGFISHDMVLINGMVYECNLDKDPAVYVTPLEDRYARLRKASKYATFYGPGPF